MAAWKMIYQRMRHTNDIHARIRPVLCSDSVSYPVVTRTASLQRASDIDSIDGRLGARTFRRRDTIGSSFKSSFSRAGTSNE